MASTYTTVLGLEKQADGENDNTWGQKLNTLFDMVEDAMCESYSVSTTGGTTALGMTDGSTSSSESRVAFIKFTGTLASNATITIPNDVKKQYILHNTCTMGAFTVTFKTVSGTGVSLVSGAKAIVYGDGTNVVEIFQVNLTALTALSTMTAAGAALLDDAAASNQRTTLGLGTAATANTGTSSGEIPILGASGMPAVAASLLTALNASNLASGTVPVARLDTGNAAAIKAETANKLVLADLMKHHPGIAKCVAVVTVSGGTPTLNATHSYNITSVTDSGTGVLTITIANDFSDANWNCQVNVRLAGVTIAWTASVAAGSVVLNNQEPDSGSFDPVDPLAWYMVGFGALA